MKPRKLAKKDVQDLMKAGWEAAVATYFTGKETLSHGPHLEAHQSMDMLRLWASALEHGAYRLREHIEASLSFDEESDDGS